MRICILGREQVGKTRFFSALKNAKYINKKTVDFQEFTMNGVTIIDTPTTQANMLDKLLTYKIDKCWIIVDGSTGLCLSDLECIQLARSKNLPFEVCIAFGRYYETDIIAQLPKHTDYFFATNRMEIKKLSNKLFGRPDKKQKEIFPEDVIEEKDIAKKLKWLVIGKENAGKSTLINFLMGYDRMTVSEIPGTTTHSIEVCAEYYKQTLQLTDTAGVKKSNASYIHYLLEKKALVIFMVDGTKGLTHHDKTLLGEILKSGLSCVIALNKLDDPAFIPEIELELNRLFKFLPVVHISALKGLGVGKLVKMCNQVEVTATTRITTNKFNKWIENNKHLFHGTKVKFACHLNTSPYEVAFFISPMTTDRHVISHLKNFFQKDFNLQGVCVNLMLRAARSAKRAKNIPQHFKDLRLRKRGIRQ